MKKRLEMLKKILKSWNAPITNLIKIQKDKLFSYNVFRTLDDG